MSDGPRARPPRWAVTGLSAGRVFGIPIYFAPSWFIIAAFITWQFAPVVNDRVAGDLGAWRYAVAAVFALLLYGSVLVHEISHSVVARALGLPVHRIVLQLLGGVSEITREPETAAREYLVAVAGPLTSILLAGIGGVVYPHLAAASVQRFVVEEFTGANALVAVFNLLPGLPLDGGRVLRAALWRLTGDKLRGTRAAAQFGRGLAIVIAVGPILAAQATGSTTAAGSVIYLWLVAFFVWTGATAALAQTTASVILPSLQAASLARRALVVPAELPVGEAVRRAQAAGVRALVTADGAGRADGVVSEAAIAAIPPERRPWVSTASVARTLEPGLRLAPDLGGEDLLSAVRDTPATEYVVMDTLGTVVGVLAQSDLAQALRQQGRAPRAARR